MLGHPIIVLGASAGGLEVLRLIVGGLPRSLPAALFVVQHIAASGPSLLAEILNRSGDLPANSPLDSTPIRPGQIYVAPPDHHMLVERNHIHILRGPKENGFRPAIDATFRTAARSYGPQVVGVVLSGMLDDGTAGLRAVKRRGGIAVVQDPSEAAYPHMPRSACRYVDVDEVLPAAEIAPMLVRLANTPAGQQAEPPVPDTLDQEARITAMEREALQTADQLGQPAPFSCPDCGGVLMEFYDGELLRYRCQVGHAFSQESMASSQAQKLDDSLWAAYRALNERATLAQRLAREAQAHHDRTAVQRFGQLARQAEQQKEQLRRLLIQNKAADTPTDEVDSV